MVEAIENADSRKELLLQKTADEGRRRSSRQRRTTSPALTADTGRAKSRCSRVQQQSSDAAASDAVQNNCS